MMRSCQNDISRFENWTDGDKSKLVLLTGGKAEEGTGENFFIKTFMKELKKDGKIDCHCLYKAKTSYLEPVCMEELLKLQPGLLLVACNIQDIKAYEYTLCRLPVFLQQTAKFNRMPVIVFTVPGTACEEPTRIARRNQLWDCVAEVHFGITNQLLLIDGTCPGGDAGLTANLDRLSNDDKQLQMALIARLADEAGALLA